MWSTVRTPAEILENYNKALEGHGETGLVFNHNFQKPVAGNLSSIDFSDNHLDLFHLPLGFLPLIDNDPIFTLETPATCANDCSGVGSCVCGVCTCFNQEDTYDCSVK